MRNVNNDIVVIAFRSDAVYLYSTHDDPLADEASNPSFQRIPKVGDQICEISGPDKKSNFEVMGKDEDPSETRTPCPGNNDDNDNGDDEVISVHFYPQQLSCQQILQLVRSTFWAQMTSITSGSDDGNFFLWRKDTGTLHGIFEGDTGIVND
jgi:WD repeat-containing protein 42A